MERWGCEREVGRRTEESRYNALQVAVLYDYAGVVRWMLRKKGVDMQRCDPGTLSPLALAVAEGSLESLQEILSSMLADPCEIGRRARLAAALGGGGPPQDLVAYVGQALAVYTSGMQTVAHLAVERGRLDALRLLVGRLEEAGAGQELRRVLELRDTSGQTALETAACRSALCQGQVQRDKYRAMASLMAEAQGLDTVEWPSHEQATFEQRRRDKGMRARAHAHEKRRLEADRQRGLVRVRERYSPRHPQVYKSLQVAQEGWEEEIRQPVEGYGVWTAPALAEECCRNLYEELCRYEEVAKSDRDLPLYTRHDGNLGSLECCGFQEVLDLIHEVLMLPVLRRCFPSQQQHVRTRHAFLTRNWFGREETFRKHRDASDITLNICLQMSPGLRGSTVKFFSSLDPEQEVLDYGHQLGHMVIHSGKEWHQTQVLLGPPDATRASLIVWADVVSPDAIQDADEDLRFEDGNAPSTSAN